MSLSNQHYLNWIKLCNQHDIKQFIPFVCENSIVGYLHQNKLGILEPFPHLLAVNSQHISFVPQLTTHQQRTDAMQQVAEGLQQTGVIKRLLSEQYDVMETFDTKALFTMDRAATTLFGIHKYGVHLNAYVIKDGHYYIWVATRARDKPTWPGKLDHLVAGGHGSGYRIEETLFKECEEEANIPQEIAQQAIPVSYVSYVMQQGEQLSRDGLFVYDLELPESFVPENTDGEVDEFNLVAIEEVLEIVSNSEQYKTNCNLVVIDFAVRHGFIKADEACYTQIVSGLRCG